MNTPDSSGSISVIKNGKKSSTVTEELMTRIQNEEPFADFMEGYYDEYIPMDETYNNAVVYDIQGYKYCVEKKQERMTISKHNNGPALASDKNRVKSVVDDFNIFDTGNEMPSP